MTDEIREALQGIIDIGKRDLSNPKYDGYFDHARAALSSRGDAGTLTPEEFSNSYRGFSAPDKVTLKEACEFATAYHRSALAHREASACTGYPTCDGDLIGEPHEAECPVADREAKQEPEGNLND